MKNVKNMFKKIGAAGIILAGLILTSCDMDVTPPDTISPETYWNTEADAVSYLNTIYNSARTSSNAVMYQDVFTDDVYNRHSHEATGYLFIQDGLSPGETEYYRTHPWSFFNIRMTNIFLQNVDNVNMSDELKSRMKLEARFWRAYDYLWKTSQFGKVPLVGDEVFPYDLPEITRNTQPEVLEYVISELRACYDGLPASYNSSNYGRVTRWAAKALQARAELLAGRYADAAASARIVIDNGGFSLKTVSTIVDQKEYEEMDQFVDWDALGIDKDVFMRGIYSYNAVWTDDVDNPEYILTRQHMDASGFTDGTRYRFLRPSQCATDGWSSLTPTQNLVDAYWTATGEEFTPPAQQSRHESFMAMDSEWVASGQTVRDFADERIANNTLKDYPYMQEFRNRDSRMYASILFAYKSWNQTEQGDFTYRYRWRTDGNEQNNESKTGFNWRKITAINYSTSSQYATATDYPVMRLAEMLLIYAEAQTMVSGYDGSVAAELNKLRARVGMPDVPSSFPSKDDAIKFIRNERRIELAGEGLRSFDMARYEDQYWIEHMNNVPLIAPNHDPSKGERVLMMSWSSRMRLKPVIQTAVDLNPALKGDQNPGY